MSVLEGSRVFVSGGAGVIGRVLVRLLAERGARVLVGDIQPRPADWPAGVLYRQGDLNFATPAELAHFAPQVFFHLAATFERSTETPGFWKDNAHHNVRLSHHLMRCMADLDSLERVVFASSYLIYDPRLYTGPEAPRSAVRLREDNRMAPRNLCGSAKLHHEIELEFLQAMSEGRTRTLCARIFRSYGRGSRDVVSRWVRAALTGETLDVFGSQALFDYVAADDVAQGLLALAESDACGIVNLGTGRARRVAELIEILRGHFPLLRTHPVAMEIPFEAAEADTTRLQEILGWTPTRTLEQMVPEIIACERRQPPPPARPQNLLITSAARKVPLLQAARDALARLGSGGRLHAADADEGALAAHFADSFWCCPRQAELRIDALIEHCQKSGIAFIIPTRDGELAHFARHREALSAAGVAVMVSPLAAVETCLDKLHFARALTAAGLPAIPTCEHADGVPSARLVVKERFGSGSQDVHCDVDPERARSLARALRAPVFQPFIEGEEFSIDLYRDRRGDVRGPICRSRDLVVDGESQITTTQQIPELESLCERAALSLDLRGHAVFQALRTPSGEFWLIECNPRFGGASTLSIAAGLDSFGWFLLEASGADLDAHPFMRRTGRLVLVRYAADRILS